jgi:hypothetical protein
MADANYMIHITQCELEQFVRQDTSSIRKSEERMIRENSTQAHCSGMQDRLMTKATETCMAVHNFNRLSGDDVAEDGEE